MSVERMWREVAVHLEDCVWAFRGSLFGGHWCGSERHTLKSGSPMGEVNLERSLDSWWSCLELVAVRVVKELCGVVWSRTMMVHVVV